MTVAGGGLLLLACVLDIQRVGQVLVSSAILAYVAVIVHRIELMRRATRAASVYDVTADEARAFPGSALPTYTVLVPAYREPEVMGDTLAALGQLDYPAHKLEIMLLLEEDDIETFDAIQRAEPPEHFQIVLAPPVGPRTKPKACNFGLTQASGELLTIYDAEDRPEPLQLRRAAVAFAQSPTSLACLQARLSYHNARQNLITRWFANEYDVWFSWFLPGLVATGAPVPLGGTSNHIRVETLIELGGWDPYNVTEDADLGLRLARCGYRVGVLACTTYEEANSDFINWVKQRSRWYKGYLQTWLVHMRRPRLLLRELGWRGMLGFTLFVAGTPMLALLNPLFWAVTAIWLLGGPDLAQQLLPGLIYHLALASWLVGGLSLLYAALVNVRVAGKPELALALVSLPLYWGMMSIAAVKAFIQLVVQPSYWEKTTHGLDASNDDTTGVVPGPARAQRHVVADKAAVTSP